MRSLVHAALGALALTTLGVGTAAAQNAPTKIAYVNSQKIVAEVPGRSEAEAQFQKELEAYKAQIQAMGDSLNKLVQDYNKAEASLSPAAKEGKQKEIRTKEQEYQRRLAEMEQKAQQREAELVGPIMQQIRGVLEEVRKEGGYAMILDAGNAAGVIVAADTTLDLTDSVIARLKAKGPVAGGGTEKRAAGAQSKPTGVSRSGSGKP